MEKKNIRRTLQHFLLGTATHEEKTAIDDWYDSFDDKQIEWLTSAEAKVTGNEIWKKIAAETAGTNRIGEMIGASDTTISTESEKIRRLLRPMRAAAVVLLLAGAAGTIYIINQRQKANCCAVASTTISTKTGERKKITIQDGSQLTLDAGTTIRIQDDFSAERKIELVDGQVFFDVAKDEKHPFVIESDGLTTTVLGTSFTISSFKELNNIAIGVTSGKISIARQSTTLTTLEKQQELVFNKKTGTHKTVPLDESLTSWQEGRLVLNDLSFDEMRAITNKHFGIDIEAGDAAIRETRYTTELLTSMTPSQAVEVLAAIHDLKYTKKDNKFFLHK